MSSENVSIRFTYLHEPLYYFYYDVIFVLQERVVMRLNLQLISQLQRKMMEQF
jgi:hypothetical protein